MVPIEGTFCAALGVGDNSIEVSDLTAVEVRELIAQCPALAREGLGVYANTRGSGKWADFTRLFSKPT